MMADDLDPIRDLSRAVAVMQIKAFGLPRLAQLDRADELAVMIPGQTDQIGDSGEFCQEPLCFRGCGTIVHEITDDHEVLRLIVAQQGEQPFADRTHSPHRRQATGSALADFVPEMQISNGEPPFAFVKKCESPIEQDVVGDSSSIWFGRKHERRRREKLWLAAGGFNGYSPRPMQRSTMLRLTFAAAVGCLAASCAAPAGNVATLPPNRRISGVRTTAYCNGEGSGGRNATGEYLSGRTVMSAAADWSRYPVGTRFRIATTNENYVIDDYGGALVGTNTIDLYKSSRAAMRSWGVRRIDIDILQWGSPERSLKILRPRKNSRVVRRMIASLEAKKK